MVSDVLVILDGASEPVADDEPTSLERADTPVLDALAQIGTVRRLRTTPEGLPAGSETGVAVLLGWTPAAPVDRAALEAAARGIVVPGGRIARRVDVLREDGLRGDAGPVATALSLMLEVHELGGHRLLVIASSAPTLRAALAAVSAPLHVWPAGVVPSPSLDGDTVVIAGSGAVAGLGRLLGARVVTASVLGDVAAAAAAEIESGTPHVVVHVDGADEAAHARNPEGKAAFLTRADEELLAPIAAAIHAHGGTLEVTADHGTDPHTGAHDDAPVPAVRWDPQATEQDEEIDEGALTDEDLPVLAVPKRRATAGAPTGRRMTERWVATLPIEIP